MSRSQSLTADDSTQTRWRLQAAAVLLLLVLAQAVMAVMERRVGLYAEYRLTGG
jgi:hypothetical protein